MEQKNENPRRWFVGVYSMESYELEAAKALGQKLTYTGYGVLVIDESIDEELLFSVVEKISVKGKVICTPAVKAHYGVK